jgi:hypothetical protein
MLNPHDPESMLTILETDTGAEWDLYKVTEPWMTPQSSGPICPATGNWAASIVHKGTPANGTGGWQGLGSEEYSTRASWTYGGTGLIRPRDTRQPAGGTWDHALAMAYSATLAGAYVYPAKGTDGRCFDTNACVPMGARLQLDPAFDCNGTSLLSHEWQRQECRTLQTYGAIIVDTACYWPCSGGGILSENPYAVRENRTDVDGGGNYVFPYDNSTWGYFPTQILQRFRVVDWNKWTG